MTKKLHVFVYIICNNSHNTAVFSLTSTIAPAVTETAWTQFCTSNCELWMNELPSTLELFFKKVLVKWLQCISHCALGWRILTWCCLLSSSRELLGSVTQTFLISWLTGLMNHKSPFGDVTVDHFYLPTIHAWTPQLPLTKLCKVF